jgi:cell wall-associated NlpC family hydrolase
MAIAKADFQYVSPSRHHELSLRLRILDVAKSYLGTPYKPGGKTKEGGIDCSGFITNVLLTALGSKKFEPLVQNISLLRTSPILETIETPEHGDLVLWEGHGGIVVDPVAGRFIGSQTSTGVAITTYRSGYWSQQPGLTFRKFGGYFFDWSRSFLSAG